MTRAGVKKARATTFCPAVPNACGSSVRNLLHISLLGVLNLEAVSRYLECLCSPKCTCNYGKKAKFTLEQAT